MTSSNHLQVPASGNPKPSSDAAPTGSPHPHTPRGQRTIKSMTPTFSFGLSFSPSFHFNSPVHSGSPHKFFHSWKRKQDSFPTLSTPPSSSRVGSSRFLDSLKKDEDDLWQSLGGESNLTSLTSIYEEGNGKEFLTPRRLHRDPTNLSSPKSTDKDENKTSTTKEVSNTNDDNNDETEKKRSRDSSTPEDRSSNMARIKVEDKKLEETIARSIKRRKMSSASIVDSPNNSIASQIDSTIDSPVPQRKHSTPSSSAVFAAKVTPTPGSSTANELGDKVWNEELDEVLIKCFLKYRDFRNNHAGYNCTSLLKSTSQNKVLSRMVYNKSGVLRTSKQISSRLFRLAKSKKLDKAPRSLKNQRTPSENNENETINDGLNDLDELIKTPFEHLISNSYSANTSHAGMDSIKTNEIIDHELDLLLSSPKNTQNINMAFRLTPKDLKITFHNSTESHVFTQSKKMFQSSLTIPSFTKLHQFVPTGILENLKSNGIPVWLVDHNVHLDIHPPNVISSTPISPFNQYQRNEEHKGFDVTNGSFDSFMRLDAKITQKFDDRQSPSMLNWKMLTKVYSNRECTSLLVEHTDAVNGYNTFDNDSFDLQVPFMKNFFTGYFNYLINGSSSEGKGLTMVQIMYNNYSDGFGDEMKFDNERSHIYGYFVHRFTFDGSTNFGSKFNIVDLVNMTEEENFKEYPLQQQNQQQQHEDDNETVVADSSPYKVSPNQSITNGQTDSPLKLGGNQLKIDIPKASDIIIQGPQTAPIYNADVVSKFNQNMLKQQESLRMQLQGKSTQQGSPPMNKAALQPPLMHSQSVNNISYFKTSNSSDNSPAMASKSDSMPGSQDQFHNISSSTPLRDTVNNAPISMSSINQVPQFIPPAQQQLMVNLGNGFVPFNSLHPKLQEQYMSVQRQFELQRHEQQKLYMSQSPNVMPQTFENDMTFMNNVSGYTMDQSTLGMNTIPTVPMGQLANGQLANQIMMPQQAQQPQPISVQPPPPVPIKENKENIRPKEIKFGPILEYDPSKDSRKVQQKVSKQNAGIHRFPINTPVSMYKPKKK